MDEQLTIFVFDDEEPIVGMLNKIITKVFPSALVKTAGSGMEGWNMLDIFNKRKIRPSIVICDYNMPGINGLQLIKKIRSSKMDKVTYCVLITASTDQELSLKSLREGADDFFHKPFSIEQLLAKLRSAARIINLQGELTKVTEINQDLIRQISENSQKLKGLVQKFQSTRLPNSDKIVKFVADAAVWIAKEMEVDPPEALNIEDAGILCYSGRLLLPERALMSPVMRDGFVANETMAEFPHYSKDILSAITGFEGVSEVLYHIYENFDGSGIPDKLKAVQIPIGSRIIRVCLDFSEMINKQGKPISKSMEAIELESKRLYDYRVVTYLDQYFAATGEIPGRINERPVSLKELEIDMTLSRSIITDSGLKLLGAGTVLDDENINKIQHIGQSDGLIGKIYVRR